MLLRYMRFVSAFLFLFSFLILIPRSVFAEEKKLVHQQKIGQSMPVSRFSVGTGVALLEGIDGAGIGIGGNIGFAFRVSPDSPVYLGMDVGYHRWNVRIKETQNGTEITRSEDLNSLQMLATIYYRFMEGLTTQAHPYLGFSVGPNLMSGSEKIKMGGNSITAGGTQVALQLYFRPGVEIDLTRSIGLNFESRIGLLEGNLMFAPQINAIFSF